MGCSGRCVELPDALRIPPVLQLTRPSPSLQDWKMSMPMHLMTLATPPAFMAMAGYLGAMLGEMLIKVRKL